MRANINRRLKVALTELTIDKQTQMIKGRFLTKYSSSNWINMATFPFTLPLFTGMVGLAPKWVRLDPKLDKSVTFSDQISVHLARAKCTEI